MKKHGKLLLGLLVLVIVMVALFACSIFSNYIHVRVKFSLRDLIIAMIIKVAVLFWLFKTDCIKVNMGQKCWSE